MAIPKKIREAVYAKYDGHCAYCGKKLAYRDMQVDHIHPRYLGGNDEFDNFNPSCKMCNFRKSTMSVDAFRREIENQADRACNTFQSRMSLAYGLIERVKKPVLFYFEIKGNERRDSIT